VILIVVCCLLGIIWAIYNIFQVEKIKVRGGVQPSDSQIKPLNSLQEELLLELGDKIS
jgi:cell division septal protein FtsQ